MNRTPVTLLVDTEVLIREAYAMSRRALPWRRVSTHSRMPRALVLLALAELLLLAVATLYLR